MKKATQSQQTKVGALAKQADKALKTLLKELARILDDLAKWEKILVFNPDTSSLDTALREVASTGLACKSIWRRSEQRLVALGPMKLLSGSEE